MQSSDIPAKFPIPFASGAGASYIRAIPRDHQAPSTTDAPASLFDGFPPETFDPLASGGIPPSGADFNGLFNQITAWSRWVQAGVPAAYDSDFATAIGGYPKNTILASTTIGKLWISVAENNTTNPDGGTAANWTAIAADFGSAANINRYPNGKIEQWGYVALSTSGEPAVAVSLLAAYANANYNVTLTPSIDVASDARDTWIQVIHNSKTTSGFSAQYQIVSGATKPRLDGFEWRCIGQGA